MVVLLPASGAAPATRRHAAQRRACVGAAATGMPGPGHGEGGEGIGVEIVLINSEY